MLSKYESGQPLFYNVFMNAILNDKLSHAYLVDSNGNSEVFEIVMSFVKEIICHDNGNVNLENICQRIDDGNYLDVKVIDSDGMWIKKEQMLSLQNEFSMRPIEGKRKIYVIKSAEKMNVQTANSILKFLEEPVDNIIAILIVDNINLILPTIISRCQVVKLNKSEYKNNSVDNFSMIVKNSKYDTLTVQEKESFIEKVISFIREFEEKKIDTLIYTKKLWHNNFGDRDINVVAADLIIYFYLDVIKYKSCLDVDFYKDKLDIIEEIASKNDIDDLAKKLEYLDNFRTSVRYNLNINLLVDKLIIDMCGDYK